MRAVHGRVGFFRNRTRASIIGLIPFNPPGNAWLLARGGRARWRIENETFNTLKNQGYDYE